MFVFIPLTKHHCFNGLYLLTKSATVMQSIQRFFTPSYQGNIPKFFIILFALTGFASAVTGPLMERIILRKTPGSVRATILSVDSLFHWVLLALVGPVIGMIADRFDLPSAFFGVGILIGILLLVVLLLWGRIRQQDLASP